MAKAIPNRPIPVRMFLRFIELTRSCSFSILRSIFFKEAICAFDNSLGIPLNNLDAGRTETVELERRQNTGRSMVHCQRCPRC